ncbi:hypothetical protein FOL47_009887 [Perkinsus chesapeaki]|uniref:Uncharacterized protein n=1 Tax=Perkinsus chesapeaki TaxID=330153 RepID=A0A7J6MQU9_PERCH|nr:hypothetical protein FOL47_009887 [Perkinsus chesapeaki]
MAARRIGSSTLGDDSVAVATNQQTISADNHPNSTTVKHTSFATFSVSNEEGRLPPCRGKFPLADRIKMVLLETIKRRRPSKAVINLDGLQAAAKEWAAVGQLPLLSKLSSVLISSIEWHPEALVTLNIPPPVRRRGGKSAAEGMTTSFTVKMYTLDLERGLRYMRTGTRIPTGKMAGLHSTIPTLITKPVALSCTNCSECIETPYRSLPINQTLVIPDPDISRAAGLFFIFELIADNNGTNDKGEVLAPAKVDYLSNMSLVVNLRLSMYHPRYRGPSRASGSEETLECPDRVYDVAMPAKYPIPGLLLVVCFDPVKVIQDDYRKKKALTSASKSQSVVIERSSGGRSDLGIYTRHPGHPCLPYNAYVGTIDLDNDDRGAFRITLSPNNECIAVARQEIYHATESSRISIYSMEESSQPVVEADQCISGQTLALLWPTPDSLISTSADGRILVWSLEGLSNEADHVRLYATVEFSQPGSAFSLSTWVRGSSRCIVSCGDSGVRMWMMDDHIHNKMLYTPPGPSDRTTSMDRSSFSSLLYVGTSAGEVIAFDTAENIPSIIGLYDHQDLIGIPVWHIRVITDEVIAPISATPARVIKKAARGFRPKNSHDVLMLTMADSTIRIALVPRELTADDSRGSLDIIISLRGALIENSLPRPDISPDGRFVVCGSSNGELNLWDISEDGTLVGDDGRLKVVVPGIIADVVWLSSHNVVICAPVSPADEIVSVPGLLLVGGPSGNGMLPDLQRPPLQRATTEAKGESASQGFDESIDVEDEEWHIKWIESDHALGKEVSRSIKKKALEEARLEQSLFYKKSTTSLASRTT